MGNVRIGLVVKPKRIQGAQGVVEGMDEFFERRDAETRWFFGGIACSCLFNHREHREHRGFWRAWMRFFNAETQRRRGFLEGTPARVCLTTENTESKEGFGGDGCVFLTHRSRR